MPGPTPRDSDFIVWGTAQQLWTTPRVVLMCSQGGELLE